ncbi:hypothetical protein JAAARDRAFT_48126 [Jaapia argillacea MUCL 33604]|uniref:Uncharacterized protein n=1 Tax=Jaapia argillacea MUCL 33604 TaxID=933084 RepID=A0A067PPZ5_9AGAM|nr:hypothetical protein JAAARDRAFT_48126 [Jaapia argillacea MUCL 33604]
MTSTTISRHLHASLWGAALTVQKTHIPSLSEQIEYFDTDIFPFDSILERVLLVRKEYVRAWDWLLEEERNRSCYRGNHFPGAIITGHPGIGKSTFVYYLLAQCLQHKMPVALPLDDTTFVLFDDQGSHQYSTEFDTENAPGGLIHWQRWEDQSDARCYIMDVWPVEEIQALSSILGLSLERIMKPFRKYGPCIRTCVDIARTPDLDGVMEKRVLDAALNIVRVRDNYLLRILGVGTLRIESEDAAMIYFVRTGFVDGKLHTTSACLSIPTHFVACAPGKCALLELDAFQQTQLFRGLIDYPRAKWPTEWLYQNWVHARGAACSSSLGHRGKRKSNKFIST